MGLMSAEESLGLVASSRVREGGLLALGLKPGAGRRALPRTR